MIASPLSLRPFAIARLPSRLPFPTTTIDSRRLTTSSSLGLQHTEVASMSPPASKRKWPRRNGGGRRSDNAMPTLPTNSSTTLTQQIKRPKVVDLQPSTDGHMDVKQLYSTAAGAAAPKPFSDLKDKLDKVLLDSLDKMGFE